MFSRYTNSFPPDWLLLYLNEIIAQLRSLSKYQYFQEITLILVIIVFFVIGRVSYSQKLAELLQIVNEA
jgi:hypothetical protein